MRLLKVVLLLPVLGFSQVDKPVAPKI